MLPPVRSFPLLEDARRVLAGVTRELAIEELVAAERALEVRRHHRENRRIAGAAPQCLSCRRLLPRHGGVCDGCGYQSGRGFVSA